ncbi:MAG: thiol:disulfide interchange protein DsbA/DsbL [Pseudomonadota bacterium]
MIQRRTFTTLAAGLGATASVLPALLPSTARAQAAAALPPGSYTRVNPPAPTAVAGKIEVVEFFSYACPHCHEFEPVLDAWAAKLPADVALRRVPIAFRSSWAPLQRLYFALEGMNAVTPALQRKIFDALHNAHARLDDPAVAADFVARNGVDRAKFVALYNGFAMQGKLAAANRLGQAYNIEGVPSLGVGGRFLTAPSMVGNNQKALAVVDALVAELRKG